MSFIGRDMEATSQVPLTRLFAPLPLPDSLTVIFTSGFAFLKYSANALAIGPTVVEPSRTMFFPSAGFGAAASAATDDRMGIAPSAATANHRVTFLIAANPPWDFPDSFTRTYPDVQDRACRRGVKGE